MARIGFLTRAAVYDEHAHLFQGYDDPSSDDIRDVHRVLATNPRLFDSWGEGLNTRYEIYDDHLGPRVRELVILATARTGKFRYIWHQHVDIAAAAGVDRDEIRAIGTMNDDPFDKVEQAVLEYTRALTTRDVTDDVHAAVADHYEADALVALGHLASEYIGIGYHMEALDLEPESPFVGWTLAGRD